MAVQGCDARLGGMPRFSVTSRGPPRPTAWSPSEMEQLLAEAAKYKSTIDKLPANLVFSDIIWLCYDTGERINAIKAVCWSDIDLTRRLGYLSRRDSEGWRKRRLTTASRSAGRHAKRWSRCVNIENVCGTICHFRYFPKCTTRRITST